MPRHKYNVVIKYHTEQEEDGYIDIYEYVRGTIQAASLADALQVASEHLLPDDAIAIHEMSVTPA